MEEKAKWAFVIDRDEFVRLSLNKILRKYGFQVVEIEQISELEGKEKEIRRGIILGDVEIEVLENNSGLVKRWADRFILMGSLLTPEIAPRLKKMGIQHIVKKPVDPRMLRQAIQQISFPGGEKAISRERKGRRDPKPIEKGGEGK